MNRINLAIPIVCVILGVIFLGYPLLQMFGTSSIDLAEMSAEVAAATWRSVKVTAGVSIFAVVLAFIYAFILNMRFSRRVKLIFSFIAIVPMLVPSIAHGTVLVYLLGKNGILTPFMWSGFDIYGFYGIFLGSFGYSFPVAFIILNLAFSNLDQRLFYAGDTMGMSWWHKFIYIILPQTKYALFSAVIVVFTMVFTDYGVPISIGGSYTVLPAMLYQQVIGLQNMSLGSLIACILIVPALISFIMDNTVFAGNEDSVSRQNKLELLPGKPTLLTKAVFIVITVLVLLPIMTICFIPFIRQWPYDLSFTFSHIIKAFAVNDLLSIMMNSVFISAFSSLFGTVLVFFAAYYTVRIASNKYSVVIMNMLFTLSMAVPGIVLGLSYVMAFSGSFLAGTFLILIIVNIVHFLGSPYLIMKNNFKNLSPNLENTYLSLGGTQAGSLFRVIIPMSKNAIVESFAYFFVNSMITISAVTFLFTYHTRTLALQITAFDDMSDTEGAVTVALVILAINIFFKAGQIMLGRRKKPAAAV